MRTCSVEGCESPHKALGWCRKHYWKYQQYGDPLGCHPSREDHVARFWANVDRSGGPDSCWPWTASGSYGYGRMWIRGDDGQRKKVGAHRISWEIHFGPIPETPENLFICHDCDNPPCCNPHHLFLGTTQDNTADRDRKGRQVCGSAHYETILTEDDVVVIRVLKKSGWIGREIAEEFGVSPSTIYKICSGKTWSHADRD